MFDKEFWFRVVSFLPMLYITYEVYVLARILKSKAWTRLMVGFLVFTVAAAYQVFLFLPVLPRLVVACVGYVLIAWAFHTLRVDLLRVCLELENRKKPVTPAAAPTPPVE